jgi:XrtJ-associated TM-motif-TM protein
MNKLMKIVLVGTVVLAASLPLHAQIGGCADSPENPTAVLALVGAASAFFVSARARFRNR